MTPIIPAHEIVGRIDAIGALALGLRAGERVGAPRLGHTGGACPYCAGGREVYATRRCSPAIWLLCEERQLLSVANLTGQDGIDFLRQAQAMCIVTHTTTYPLRRANETLADLRADRLDGAVLVP